ncbi:hypothetical protein [Luteimonas saliphila]|uniref:hypothetical protein n=1 Tax=Luteimonas saliphila TaxID=2804919 RepID=UPI00192DA92D|nr:hypothetical protein [Luteimonas saliphila]
MAQPGKPASLILQVLLVLLLPVSPRAAAQDAAPREQEQARPYVETSYLIAPRRVGDFVLQDASYDEGRKYSGAGFRYAVEGHQETRIDVYVYPAGRMPRASALTGGMAGFRADLARAVDAGTYADLVLEDEQEFALVEDSTVAAADTPGDGDSLEAILAIVASGNRPSGRKLPMTMTLQPHGWPMQSVGYLFYRQLYYFKLRASAAQERIASADFDALVDRAARTLVPAIEVANVGACARSVIHVTAEAPAEEVAREMVMQGTEHQGYNCHETAEAADIGRKSADAEVVEIAYRAEEWNAP